MAKQFKNRVPVSVGIPFDLLSDVDEKVAKENWNSRSDYIVNLIKKDLRTAEVR